VTCPQCGGKPLQNPVRALYEEVRNEQATWTDAVFWYVMGALSVGAFCWVR
jgi:hypothetical protein